MTTYTQEAERGAGEKSMHLTKMCAPRETERKRGRVEWSLLVQPTSRSGEDTYLLRAKKTLDATLIHAAKSKLHVEHIEMDHVSQVADTLLGVHAQESMLRAPKSISRLPCPALPHFYHVRFPRTQPFGAHLRRLVATLPMVNGEKLGAAAERKTGTVPRRTSV